MIVATAGHVDHGKTLLVKKLTGMDTDRLEEEKRRGLSINLGFAYRKSDDNKTVAFVDVPGHIRFINNMIAGINGIDLGMLVVAADDGPMPQTREHMDVLKLLGVTKFALIISKIDRVDKTRVALVKEQALSLFPESSQAPVFEVDTPAEKGISALGLYLESEANKLPAKSTSGHFRLSIDRAFLMKGSGLIVTGTVASGTVQQGDTLILLPQNVSVRLRSLQAQEEEKSRAFSGQRCALNISGGVEKDDIERGDWLVAPEINHTTMRFDARISLLRHAPFALKHMSPIKLYIGAKRISARLALLEQKTISPGQTGLVQLIVKRALHCCHGDRFLLRDDSENEILGGGVVLDTNAVVGKRSASIRLHKLAAMEQSAARQVLASLLFEHKQIVDLSQFCLNRNIRADEEADVLGLAEHKDGVMLIDIEGSRKAVSRAHWQSTGAITLKKDRAAQYEQEQVLSNEQQQLWTAIESCLLSCGLQVPGLGDIGKKLGCEHSAVLMLCKIASKQKSLIMVAGNRYMLPEHIRQLSNVVQSLANEKGHFSIAEFRKECGIGRNLAVEVLEYFDKIGFTLRAEAGRVILHKDRVDTMIT